MVIHLDLFLLLYVALFILQCQNDPSSGPLYECVNMTIHMDLWTCRDECVNMIIILELSLLLF